MIKRIELPIRAYTKEELAQVYPLIRKYNGSVQGFVHSSGNHGIALDFNFAFYEEHQSVLNNLKWMGLL